MKPVGKEIVFSASQFRTYGATAAALAGWEEPKGCPRVYRKKYVDKSMPPERRSEVLEYGSMMHAVLQVMEESMLSPEDALAKVWSPVLPFEMWQEALTDLNKYLERGGPMTRFGTLDVEISLKALLYEDEDFGPVFYRGIIDWLGLDVEMPSVLHMVDYKTNRHPPSRGDVLGDVQLKSYDWLVRQNWAKWSEGTPVVVTHLDAIKFKDVEVMYQEHELEEWHDWAVATARSILRDEVGAPSLSVGCNWCSVKSDCEAFAKLPEIGVSLAEREAGETLDEMWVWRENAKRIVKMLDARINEIDKAAVEAVAAGGGEVSFADQRWVLETAWKNEVDMVRLHELVGSEFYGLVTTTKTALNKFVKGKDPSSGAQILACLQSAPSGTRIGKHKAGDSGE